MTSPGIKLRSTVRNKASWTPFACSISIEVRYTDWSQFQQFGQSDVCPLPLRYWGRRRLPQSLSCDIQRIWKISSTVILYLCQSCQTWDTKSISQVYPVTPIWIYHRLLTRQYMGILSSYCQLCCEGYIFRACEILADVPCWLNARKSHMRVSI